MRKIRISFPDGGASATADLLEDDAPNTCDAIWSLLPLRLTAIHDIWSGHEVLAHLDNTVVLKPENVLTYIPMPGDIFYYYRPPHYFRGAPYGRSESAELGIVYDRDTRPQGPRGPEGVNLFANISSGLEDLARACDDMIYRGRKDLLIEKVI
ncbi:MAG: DUF3830 family protein [Actinomycetota bacterium]|nr:DUF3830 family protein [Actinomycetota bacterium]